MLVHYFLDHSEGTEQVEKAQTLIDNCRYMWKERATVSLHHKIALSFSILIGQFFFSKSMGAFAHPGIAHIVKTFFSIRFDCIPKSLGSMYLSEFHDFDKHRELVALSLAAVSLNRRKHYPILTSLLDTMHARFNYCQQEDQLHHGALCKGTWETCFWHQHFCMQAPWSLETKLWWTFFIHHVCLLVLKAAYSQLIDIHHLGKM